MVKGGLGTRNSSPLSAAPSLCRLNERDRKPSAQALGAVYWVEAAVGHVFQHPDTGLEQQKLLLHERG